MAYYLVDRCAYALWKTFIIKWCRNSTMTYRFFMYPVINLLCGHTRSDMLCNIIKNCDIDLTALFDLFNLCRCFNQIMVKNCISFLFHKFHFFIKCFMAFFIFLSASAPARIVSFDFLCHFFSLLLQSDSLLFLLYFTQDMKCFLFSCITSACYIPADQSLPDLS